MGMNDRLSKKWLYTFIGIAVASLTIGIAALFYKEYVTAVAMGLVLTAQIINIVKWKRR